jgi:hypothetical protein
MTGRPPVPTLAEATAAWARIAMLSFGGPAGCGHGELALSRISLTLHPGYSVLSVYLPPPFDRLRARTLM